MRKYLLSALCLGLFACANPNLQTPQGGNNGNDRSNGGEQGETLLTGAMVIAPDGKFALMQRNQTSVLLDVEAGTARELPEQVERFVFSKAGGRGLAVLPDRKGLVMYDLPSLAERWRTTPALIAQDGARLARWTDDGKTIVLGDAGRVLVLDAESGDVRGAIDIVGNPEELTFVPGQRRALVVGSTVWTDHKPATAVVDVDLGTLAAKSITIPNCTAPIEVLPDASRALLSPTFCEEGTTSTTQQTWTNPDPVSIIDLGGDGPKFLKNLPGFGPVALDKAGHRAVAYLDVNRMDASMFDDKSKVPAAGSKRYHIMTIDPKTLAFDLTPVGNVMPRFALAKNESTLLVDATVQQFRGEAEVKATIDATGRASVSVNVFGKNDSLFGTFDLDTKQYAPITGQAASLDRFVQLGDAKRVFTLRLRTDGSGGDLYRIDLDAKTSTSLGKSLRDIGLVADGSTMLLRERLPAVQVTTSTSVDWYRHEQYCLSLDGVSCLKTVEFTDSKPFQSGPVCKDYHDC